MSDSEHTKKLSNGAKERELSQFLDNSNGQTVVYQYLCPRCQHITEERFPFGDPDPQIQCRTSNCNSVAQKIISTPNVLTGIPTHEARRGRGKGK